MKSISDYIPRSLLLQWHVTNRCNLRCNHCYQQEYSGRECSFGELLTIVSQYERLLADWRSIRPIPRVRGHLTVTGGEPFVRADFMDLPAQLYARRGHFSFAILTNGTLIDSSAARRLAGFKPRFVQVSIEGTEQTHDRIRGRGSYAQAVAAIRSLRAVGVRTFISFTAHRDNFREFTAVARLGCSLRVERVWTDRLIPSGSGATLDGVLSPRETRELFELLRQARAEARKSWFNRTEIAAHRALQFLVCGTYPYHCTAGDRLLTVMPDGDLYPCRRMPVRVGNLFEAPLGELYYHSPLLNRLRDINTVSKGCERCCFNRICRGGLRCLAHAVYGDPFKADPGCWLPQHQSAGENQTMSNEKRSRLKIDAPPKCEFLQVGRSLLCETTDGNYHLYP